MFFKILMFGVALLMGSSTAIAAKRVAFLVGNSDYEYATRLANPVRDVQLLSETLERLDFVVTQYQDLTRDEIGKNLLQFLKENRDADLTLFYFAGHGMQFDGRNYLVGIDAQLETEFDVESESLDLDRVVGMLERSSKAALVFVDACRDNPLANDFYRENFSQTRALRTRGLAPLRSKYNGAMITFSAAPGQVAFDGDDYSPFAKSLAKHLPSENMEVLSLMKRVIRDVKNETENKQTPLVSNDLTQEIYLKLSEDGAGNSVALAQEKAIFDAAFAIGGARAWETYFRKYPNGFFKELALIEHERLTVANLAEASGLNIKELDTSKPIAISRDVAAKAEQSLGLTKDDAKRVQQALNTRGYNAGVVDGAIGRGTRKAIADFQASVDLPSTGVVTAATADALDVKLEKAEESNTILATSGNARRYDPKLLALVEDDKRLIKAAEALKSREYVYGFFGGKIYIVVLSWSMTWDSAKNLADRAGGYLVAVNSKSEDQFLKKLSLNDDRFWRLGSDKNGVFGPGIGLYQVENAREPNGGWVWVSEEPVDYDGWRGNEPNNSGGNEDFAVYAYYAGNAKYESSKEILSKCCQQSQSKLTWIDVNDFLDAFIIEIDG